MLLCLPNTIRAIHQEKQRSWWSRDAGMANATAGRLQSRRADDRVDACVLKSQKYHNALKKQAKKSMFITNFVHERRREHKKIMRYTLHSPENHALGWCTLRRGKYMMMHLLIYNMKLFQQIRLHNCQSIVLRGFICLVNASI